MARIIYPEDFIGQRNLSKGIKEKVDADGVTSVLIPLFAQKEIDPVADAATGILADAQEAKRILKKSQSENFIQLRDLIMVPIAKDLRGSGQFLKSFYKPNVDALGEWAYVVIGGNKINFPVSFTPVCELFTGVKAKNDSYGSPADSPLNPYLTQQNVDMTANALAVAEAIRDNDSAGVASRASEDATESRIALWSPVDGHSRDAGDYLMKLYANNPRKLGEYSFVIDDNKKAPTLRKSTVKPASRITVNGVTIGTAFTNTGTVNLNVYKGGTVTGTPVVVSPGELFGMIKGYSVITVLNPSTLVGGKFTTKGVK